MNRMTVNTLTADSMPVMQAFRLTDSPLEKVSSRVLYHRAKSRWEIENQGFNDAKNRHGLGHVCHHHSQLAHRLVAHQLGVTIERLYRLRYLRRALIPSALPWTLFICFG